MKYTEHYKIPKPDLEDTINITDIHSILDKVDNIGFDVDTTSKKIKSDEETRIENEKKRVLDETKRVENEKKRVLDETKRVENEKNIEIEESKRVSQESERNTNESKRIEQELKRVSNEELRVETDKERVAKESIREQNEMKRKEQESIREQNEAKRVEQESTREQTFKIMEESFSKNAPGDMTKAIYDKDDDGIVDNAKMVNGHTVECDVPGDAKFTDTIYNDEKLIATIDNIAKNIKDGKVKQAEVADSVDWENIKNKPKSSGIDEKVLKELENIKLNQMELVFQRELENKSTSMDVGYYVDTLRNKERITTNAQTGSEGIVVKGNDKIELKTIKSPFKTDKITLYIKSKQHKTFNINGQSKDGVITFNCDTNWDVEVLD